MPEFPKTKDILRKRQVLLDKYFLARTGGTLPSTGEGCEWCEKFIELEFTCCLNCGYIIDPVVGPLSRR